MTRISKPAQSRPATKPAPKRERGRPSKFSEPVVRKQFELPESLNNDLLAATGPTPDHPEGIDQTTFLREAVRQRLQSLKNGDQAQLPPLPEIIAQSVEAAVAEALDRTSIRVAISETSRPKLEDIAGEWGFSDASELFRTFAARMLSAPEETESFLKRSTRAKVAKRVRIRATTPPRKSPPSELDRAA